MYSVSDHAYTGSMEADYNKTLRMLYDVEIESNVTRIYANLNKKDKKQMAAEAKALGIPIADYIKQTSAIVNTDFAGDKSGDAFKQGIQLIQGNPKFQEY